MSTRLHLHQTWLGLVQPVEGLVVSAAVLADLESSNETPAGVRAAVLAAIEAHKASTGRDGVGVLALLGALGLHDACVITAPEELAAFAVAAEDGARFVVPTAAIRGAAVSICEQERDDRSQAGLLVMELKHGTDFDSRDAGEEGWAYPPSGKMARLLSNPANPCTLGLIGNGQIIRLVYQPADGSAAGHINFPVAALSTVDGRPIIDGLYTLLGPHTLDPPPITADRCLEAMCLATRHRQAEVSTRLAEQALAAIDRLLEGFEAAGNLQPGSALANALNTYSQSGEFHDDIYGGLLTVLLRLVFLLFAEDRDLLPMDDDVYRSGYSVTALYDALERDHARFPDAMDRRFSAWPRLLALFRGVFTGFGRAAGHCPERHGELFDPDRYPFLEGRLAGDAMSRANHADLQPPLIDDATVLFVLRSLCRLQGQRLSYRTLAVEQIGAVYEGLMGWQVRRLEGRSVRLPETDTWLCAEELLAMAAGAQKAILRSEYGMPNAQAANIAAACAGHRDASTLFEALRQLAGPRAPVRDAGRWVLQPGATRRRTSAHYTPRELSERVVARALQPVLAQLGPTPPSSRLLQLKLLDPAMGSGAFLVEACRQLADHVVAAWAREGVEGTVDQARRRVAQSCLYGADLNPYAVTLAKLSLWLFTLARDLPFTFVDHALVHGDSLVGLDLRQVLALHWAPDNAGTQVGLWDQLVRRYVDAGLARRRRILAMAADDTEGGVHTKTQYLRQAHDDLQRVNVVADAVLGAFFEHTAAKARDRELHRRVAAIENWLSGGIAGRSPAPAAGAGAGPSGALADLAPLQNALFGDLGQLSLAPGEIPPAPPQIQAWATAFRAHRPALHWPLVFPEVFADDRKDVLANDRAHAGARFDVVIGNPPFLRGKSISTSFGTEYQHWLMHNNQPALGGGDLCAYFFRRSAYWLGNHGTFGLIATNTIAQGDTRETGLDVLVRLGFVLYDAQTDIGWAGDASVTVSIVHAATGSCRADVQKFLNDRPVAELSTALTGGVVYGTPRNLAVNANRSFQGMIVLGLGFTLTPEERDEFVAADPRNAERIFPYLGGREVNSHPEQMFDRYVIDFADMPLEEAAQWPGLIERLERLVKPERELQKRNALRDRWWQYADKRPALRRALEGLPRCLVTSCHSPHLIFVWQPSTRLFSHGLYVFPTASDSLFAILQSRPHEVWARRFGSSMETRLRYTATDVFETFPFPPTPSMVADGPLWQAGETLYAARAEVMKQRWIGLTKLYNALHDPHEPAADLQHLRHLHQTLDEQVCLAYGWPDLASTVPPYGAGHAESAATLAWQAQVLERLWGLNGG